MKVLGLSGLLLLPLLAFLLPSHSVGYLQNEESLNQTPKTYVLEIEAVPYISNDNVQKEPANVIPPEKISTPPEPVKIEEPLAVSKIEEPSSENVNTETEAISEPDSDDSESLGSANTQVERAKSTPVLRLTPKELERANTEDLEKARQKEPDRANSDGSVVEPPAGCLKNSEGL